MHKYFKCSKKEINSDLFVLVIYIPTEAYKRVVGKILVIVCALFASQLSITDGNNSCLQDVIVIRDRLKIVVKRAIVQETC